MSILRRTCVILAAFAFMGLTTACGQTGPLYLPGKPQPITPKTNQDSTESSDMPANPR